MITRDSLLPPPHVVKVGTTLMKEVIRGQRVGRILSRINLPGRTSGEGSSGKAKERLSVIPHDQPRASSRINDNHCVDRVQTRLLAGSQPPGQTINTLLHQNVNFPVAKVVHSAPGLSQKKEVSPGMSDCYMKEYKIKICEKCFLCHSIVLCKTCNKCNNCCSKSVCRGKTSKLLTNLAGSGCWSESNSNPERGLYPSLSDPAQLGKVSHSRKLLCQSPQEPLPAGGITSAYR